MTASSSAGRRGKGVGVPTSALARGHCLPSPCRAPAGEPQAGLCPAAGLPEPVSAPPCTLRDPQGSCKAQGSLAPPWDGSLEARRAEDRQPAQCLGCPLGLSWGLGGQPGRRDHRKEGPWQRRVAPWCKHHPGSHAAACQKHQTGLTSCSCHACVVSAHPCLHQKFFFLKIGLEKLKKEGHGLSTGTSLHPHCRAAPPQLPPTQSRRAGGTGQTAGVPGAPRPSLPPVSALCWHQESHLPLGRGAGDYSAH